MPRRRGVGKRVLDRKTDQEEPAVIESDAVATKISEDVMEEFIMNLGMALQARGVTAHDVRNSLP